MRLNASILLSVAAGSAVVNGFSPSPMAAATRVAINEVTVTTTSQLSMATETDSTPCDIPEDVINPDLVSQKGSGSLLRDAMLTDVNDKTIRLGDKMGDGTSVVIFLRHMG